MSIDRKCNTKNPKTYILFWYRRNIKMEIITHPQILNCFLKIFIEFYSKYHILLKLIQTTIILVTYGVLCAFNKNNVVSLICYVACLFSCNKFTSYVSSIYQNIIKQRYACILSIFHYKYVMFSCLKPD